MTTSKVIGVLVAIALLFGLGFYASKTIPFGAIATGAQHYQMESFLQGLTLGTRSQSQVSNAGLLTLSTTGNAITRVNFGKCIIFAYATTIAASSTATVDCQSGAAALTALTGVTSGDNVFVQATTTLSSAYLGVRIISAAASSTAGFITMTLVNETGTTFTWSGTASSSMQYAVIH